MRLSQRISRGVEMCGEILRTRIESERRISLMIRIKNLIIEIIRKKRLTGTFSKFTPELL